MNRCSKCGVFCVSDLCNYCYTLREMTHFRFSGNQAKYYLRLIRYYGLDERKLLLDLLKLRLWSHLDFDDYIAKTEELRNAEEKKYVNDFKLYWFN